MSKYRLIGSWLFCNNQAINLQYVYEIYRDQNVLYFYYGDCSSQIDFDSVAEAENELYNILITLKDWDNTMIIKEKKK